MEISCDERFTTCLQYLAQKFNLPIIKNQSRQQITFPLNFEQEKLFAALMQIITVNFKSYYLTQQLKIKDDILVRVLINYDQKTDKIIAAATLEITPVMLLDAIYDFRLSQLKQRWDEIIHLVNDHHTHLLRAGHYTELLQFLIQNLEHKVKEVHLLWRGNHPQVCDHNLQAYHVTTTNTIFNIIDLAPQEIYLHLHKKMPSKLITQIQKIFSCVTIIKYD